MMCRMAPHNIRHRNVDLQGVTTVKVVAKQLDVCEETVRRRIRQGKIEAHKSSGIRQWLILLPAGHSDAE